LIVEISGDDFRVSTGPYYTIWYIKESI